MFDVKSSQKKGVFARLNDHTGKGVAFGGETAPADTAGPWTVLAFYPKALTGG
jgi:peroxiredoxin